MNLSRISRLVQLLGLLQAGKGHNASELAAACEVSRRTIFRDLDVLRQAGVPLLFDDEQGVYRIPGTYFLPPTNFTAEEALAVMVLCYELGRNNRLPFYEAAQSAALKLESSLPTRVREILREATSAVQIKMQPGNRLQGQQPDLSAAFDLHRHAPRRADRLRQFQRRQAASLQILVPTACSSAAEVGT